MTTFVQNLANDAAFRQRAGTVDGIPAGAVQPLDAMLGHLRRFGTARRREVRLAQLKSASRAGAAKWQAYRSSLGDAIAGFQAGLAALTEQAVTLRPLITPALDGVIALAADDEHPLRIAIHETARSFGVSDDEIEWAFGELAGIDFQPVRLVCADGFEDLRALLDSLSCGELGLLQAGFARFTGATEIDQRIERLIGRLRAQDVTASLLLALIIVVTAHFVDMHRQASVAA